MNCKLIVGGRYDPNNFTRIPGYGTFVFQGWIKGEQRVPEEGSNWNHHFTKIEGSSLVEYTGATPDGIEPLFWRTADVFPGLVQDLEQEAN
jgi:hypothetical protein